MSVKLGDILMNMNPCDIRTKQLIFCPVTDGNAVRYTEIAADTAWRRREQFHPLVDWGLTRKIHIRRSARRVQRETASAAFEEQFLLEKADLTRFLCHWLFSDRALQTLMPRLRASPSKERRRIIHNGVLPGGKSGPVRL